ncbi:MAG: GNAT family N-acetyltransferase [Acidobacteria bacterium]|nr:GNAT family N-acetyltransferase [Acidobacteriota bacterium]
MNLRLLNRSDLPTVMAFKDLVGWNQSLLDWERFLKLNPAGCFACEIGGAVIGIVTTLMYSDGIGCIGTLLVAPSYRRQGIGVSLFKNAVEHLEARGADTLRLITPPLGKSMFEKLGFVAEYEIERWVLHRETVPSPGPIRAPLPDFEKILNADREVFGADRSELLRSLHADAPDFTLATELEGEVIGYALGRGGSSADQLGPWVAWDQPTARELLDEFLRRSGRDTLFVDCPRSNEMARELLLSKGFRISRPLLCMTRGSKAHFGHPELFCSILGPEFA